MCEVRLRLIQIRDVRLCNNNNRLDNQAIILIDGGQG